jgi:hypothetical protein
MKTLKIIFGIVLLFCFSFLKADVLETDINIEIDVAPNVLNIASSGTVVTVHTDIAYSTVEGASVTLNNVEIAWWKSDSRGQFVAKFNMEELETLVNTDVLELGEITLELKGLTKAGESFSGTQVISVVNIAPAGNAKK